MTSLLDVARALTFYRNLEGAEVDAIAGGLINETFLIRFGPQRFVLQKVSPIFDPKIHDNIARVTAHLEARGIVTPKLIPTRHDELTVQLDDIGCWRLMTYVEGATHHHIPSAQHAASAGELVGRFHSALEDLDHTFEGMRLGVHDTDAHLESLETALADHRNHALASEVRALASEIHTAADALPPLAALPNRVCHGDLKISNILFDDAQATCLIDLDTLGPMMLAHELGDAWRSWCGATSEEHDTPKFDLVIFEASWRGYLRGVEREISADERKNLLVAPEWISLELAARFAADTLNEAYFGWDATRYPTAAAHNHARARGQLALHRATRDLRGQRAKLLDLE